MMRRSTATAGRGRRLRAALAVAAAVVALVGGAGLSPASAAGGTIEVSRDGITYAPALTGGLFDGAGQLVPGQSVTRDLWIRNPSRSPSALRVSIRNLASTSTVFAQGVTLTSGDSLPGSATEIRSLADLAKCDVVSSAPSLDAGAVVKLTLTFTMADLTQAVAQNDHAALDLVVAMRDASAGAFGGSACGDEGTLLANTGDFRSVAFTGGSIPAPLVIGGGLLFGVGMFLVAARRRRQSEDD